MAKLFLIRHGETRKNLNKKLHAAGDPEQLNETGKRQIQKVADFLKPYLPFELYCSKEVRAQESAEIISKSLSVPLNEVSNLQERNWGKFAGKSWDDVKKVLDPMSLEERYNYVPEGGESWREFETRLVEALMVITKDEKQNVVVVTHGGAIRALMPFLLNAPKEESFKYDPDNASISVFENRKGKFEKVKVNETGYLKD